MLKLVLTTPPEPTVLIVSTLILYLYQGVSL